MNSHVKEVIFIGFPSPTHHYGGLAADNVASNLNRGSESSPLFAALQAIQLMRHLLELGQVVGVLPPHLRPHLPLLEDKGFTIENAPLALLETASSSSAMWAANAATISPNIDSADGILHITTANLHTNEHRRIEAETTYKNLAKIFSHVPKTIVHPPLDANLGYRDEGAANHMRLSPSHDDLGLHIFIYGGRQSLSASQAVAAQHKLNPEHVLFIEQSREAIAAGVFHNDVIAVSHLNTLLVHEQAYAGGTSDIEKIENSYSALNNGAKLNTIIIGKNDLSLEEAVHSYFFNSQIIYSEITSPSGRGGGEGKFTVIAPQEIEILYSGKAANLMRQHFANVHSLDLRQSMKNGGGPACLRLRIPMTEEQISALKTTSSALVNEEKLTKLEKLAQKYYPEKLVAEDLHSKTQLEACKKLLDEW